MAIAVGVLLVALFVNLNFVQVVKGDDYRNNSANRRVHAHRVRERRAARSSWTASAVAESVATNDELKYLRKYPSGPVYAPLTGYYSLIYDKNELEKAEDKVLSGNDPPHVRLAHRRHPHRPEPKGGSVNLTINNAAQTARPSKVLGNRRGAVVALDPTTGAILAAASSPSYDPSIAQLAQHRRRSSSPGRPCIDDKTQPLLNRAFNQSYPPGSIFKVVVSAAALEGRARNRPTSIPAPGRAASLPGTATATMHELQRRALRQRQDRHSRLRARRSRATPRSPSSASTSASSTVEAEAELFGMDNEPRSSAAPCRARSTIGEVDNDRERWRRRRIGQRNVQMTPLQAAMMSAAVANDGTLMTPYLVATGACTRTCRC